MLLSGAGRFRRVKLVIDVYVRLGSPHYISASENLASNTREQCRLYIGGIMNHQLKLHQVESLHSVVYQL